MISRLAQQLEGITSEQVPIVSAKVPILKIREKETGVHMDISFNSLEGFKAIETVKLLQGVYPPLRPLVLVLKEFLRERRLNETFAGGIGSFLIVILVLSFLQYRRINEPNVFERRGLGELLGEFFRFFAYDFNYEELGISVIGEGTFFDKAGKGCYLTVENPQDPNVDMGKSVRQYSEVLRAFRYAANALRSGELNSIIHPLVGRK